MEAASKAQLPGLLRRALGRARSGLDRDPAPGHRHLPGPVLGPHVRHHGRLPPLFRPPHLQDEPGLPVRPRLHRRLLGPERPLVVGRQPPGPPPLFRYGQGRPLAVVRRFLLVPHGLDIERRLRGSSLQEHRRFRQVPRTPVARPPHHRRAVRPGAGHVPRGRLERPVDRIFPEHGGPLPRHLHDQFLHAPLGLPALPHGGHEPQHAHLRAPHPGRGLAQQPPLLPVVLPPGLLLVGDRHHLLRPQGPLVGGARLGHQERAARGARGQPLRRR